MSSTSMQAQSRQPVVADSRRRRRLWLMRLVALSVPLVVLAVLEISFRVVGAYPPDSWASAYVSFEEDSVLFPNWDREFAMPKPPGTVRVVVLGGSSTYGFGVERPFGQLLQEQLSQQGTGRRIEVLNGGIPAIGSHRVFEVLKRSTEFDVDVALVYLGHNEFLEEIFFDPQAFTARAMRAGRWVRQSRVVNWLGSMAEGLGISYRPRLQRHFIADRQFPLIRSDEEYQNRLNFLEANVRQMIALAKARGIRIVFMPEIPNWLTPPGNPEHGPAYASHASKWDALFARFDETLRAAAAGIWQPPAPGGGEDVVTSLEQLCALDDQYATSHYLLGLALLDRGDAGRGFEALVRANLLDRRGDRSNRDIHEAICRVCAAEDVPCLDVRQQFAARLPDELRRMARGEKLALFSDHCHPTHAGHQMLADAFAPHVLPPGDNQSR